MRLPQVSLAIGLLLGFVTIFTPVLADEDCTPNREIVYSSDSSGENYQLYQFQIPQDQDESPDPYPLLYGVPELSRGMVDAAPRWASDGFLITFMSSRQGNYDIFFGWLAGAEWKLLVLDAKPENESLPDWSPDSEIIAYTVSYEGNEEIVITPLRTPQSIRLTDNPARDFQPSWSPDGESLVFVSDRDGNADLFVLNLDDQSAINLTQSDSAEYAPDWSPDGKMIAFESDAGGSVQIWTLDVESGETHQLTDELGMISSPQWSPDGKYLITMGRGLISPEWDLYLITVDTGAVRQLTDNDSNDMFPAWRICPESNTD